MFDVFKTDIRRVDDLGRIVIPKIMRNKLCINEGDMMTQVVDGKRLLLMKAYRLDQFRKEAQAIVEEISSKLDVPVVICNPNVVVASSAIYYTNATIKREVAERTVEFDSKNTQEVLKPFEEFNINARWAQPIVVNDNIEGYIIVLEDDDLLRHPEKFEVEDSKEQVTRCIDVLIHKMEGATE